MLDRSQRNRYALGVLSRCVGQVLSLGAVLAQVASVGPAAAQANAAATRPVVAIAIAGPDAEASRLGASLSDSMRRLGVSVEWRAVTPGFPFGDTIRNLPATPEPDEQPTLARLSLDLRQPGVVILYLKDERRDRLLVRRFDAPSGIDEVAREQLVVTAADSIEAILAGQLVGTPRALQQPTRPPPKAPAATTSPPQLRATYSVAGGYTTSWIGPGALAQGAFLGLKWDRPAWGAGVGVRGYFPWLVDSQGVDALRIRFTVLGLRARAWTGWQITPRVSTLMGLGLVGDATQVSPRTSEPAAAIASDPYWAFDAAFQGYVGLAFQGRGWAVTGVVGADATARAVRYAVEVQGGRRNAFAPSRFRPFLELELAASFLR